jgi:heme exporter protein D
MSHAFYIYASYGFAGGMVVAVVAWTWFDGHLRRRELASLEAVGIRRRSQRKAEGETR